VRCYGFHELPAAVRLFVIDKVMGGLSDLLFDYDRERQTLRWWRLESWPDGPTPMPKRGSVFLPAEMVAEIERLDSASGLRMGEGELVE
jgi:hypothetical protein